MYFQSEPAVSNPSGVVWTRPKTWAVFDNTVTFVSIYTMCSTQQIYTNMDALSVHVDGWVNIRNID